MIDTATAHERFDHSAGAGKWRAAWGEIESLLAVPVGDIGIETLLRAHGASIRNGLDTHRAWLRRALWRHHRDRRASWSVSIIDRCRQGRGFDALELESDGSIPQPIDVEEALTAKLATARLRTWLRDHERAHAALDEALAISGDDPRITLERCWVLEGGDRIDEALETITELLRRHPRHPLANEQRCWLQDSAGRHRRAEIVDGNAVRDGDPAIDAAREALGWIECTPLSWSLVIRHYERKEWDLAEAAAREVLSFRPLGRRASVAMHSILVQIARERGDRESALLHARAGGRALRAWTALLEREDTGARRILDVPFVRQDHLTCSPATMASILAFHRMPIDQAEIAKEVTYDGTPSHGELHWAERRGLGIRFFEFDSAKARELIDRDLPFAISIRWETGGHRVALIGYDTGLDTFLVRDPGTSYRVEWSREQLERMTSDKGGLCAILGPADLIDSIDPALTPNADACRELVLMWQLFEQRRFEEAMDRARRLEHTPTGRVGWETKLAVTYEHSDRATQAVLFRQRCEEHPEDSYWKFRLASALRSGGRLGEAIEVLESACSGWRPSPHLLLMLADMIRDDATERGRAEALVRRALRRTGTDASAARHLPDVLWHDRKRRSEATELYRVVAVLAPFDERLARSCAIAYSQTGQPELGIEFLRRRAEKHGARSSQPARTLASALTEHDRRDEAIAVLNDAAAIHDDVLLHFDRFDALLDAGRLDEAALALATIGDRGGEDERWLARHRLERRRGNGEEALAAIERAHAANPRWPIIHRYRQKAILDLRGRAAAIEAAESAVKLAEHDPLLLGEIADFLHEIEDRDHALALQEKVMLARGGLPEARAEFAWHLQLAGRLDDAMAHYRELESSLNDSAAYWNGRARTEGALGDVDAAARSAERALELSPYHLSALHSALGYAADPTSAQRILDATIDRWLNGHRPPTGRELTSLLDKVRDAHGAAHVRPLMDRFLARFPDAEDLRVESTRLLVDEDPKAALAAAAVLHAERPNDLDCGRLHTRCLAIDGQVHEQRTTLEALLRSHPSAPALWIELGESFERHGDLGAAIDVYRRGIDHAPGSAMLWGYLADAQWSLDRHEDAIAAVRRAIELDRSYTWAIRTAIGWLAHLGRHDDAVALADEIVRATPYWPAGRLGRAQALGLAGRHEEKLAELEAALRIDPRLGEARSELLQGLLEMRRFDRAREVARRGIESLGDRAELAEVEAQIAFREGRLDDAIAEQRNVLGRHPDHGPGWDTLWKWLGRDRRFDALLDAVAAAPAAIRDGAAGHNYRALALFGLERSAEGEAALRKALEKSPGHDWTRRRLADHLLEQDRPDEVIELLAQGDVRELPSWQLTLVARAAAKCKRGDVPEAALRELLGRSEVDCDDLDAVATALREVDDRRLASVRGDFAEVRSPAVAVNLLHLHALLGETAKFRAQFARLWEVLDKGAAETRGAALLANHRDRFATRQLGELADRHFTSPVSTASAWGDLAYALSGRATAPILTKLLGSDYRRPGLEGWMLANLASAQRQLERWEELAAVCRYALADLPHDHSSWWFERFLRETDLATGRDSAWRSDPRLPSRELVAERARWLSQRLVASLRVATSRTERATIVRAQLPELLATEADARRRQPSSLDGEELRAKEIWTLYPSIATWLLGGGAIRRRLRKWLGYSE
ncbi:MAG: tetratricopeptide repeat protein [Planctomycetota bacterium]